MLASLSIRVRFSLTESLASRLFFDEVFEYARERRFFSVFVCVVVLKLDEHVPIPLDLPKSVRDRVCQECDVLSDLWSLEASVEDQVPEKQDFECFVPDVFIVLTIQVFWLFLGCKLSIRLQLVCGPRICIWLRLAIKLDQQVLCDLLVLRGENHKSFEDRVNLLGYLVGPLCMGLLDLLIQGFKIATLLVCAFRIKEVFFGLF